MPRGGSVNYTIIIELSCGGEDLVAMEGERLKIEDMPWTESDDGPKAHSLDLRAHGPKE